MDYPFDTIGANDGEMLVNIAVSVRSETTRVTPDAITNLIRDYLQTIQGLEYITAARSEITQTNVSGSA
ncbi:hypothetical protein [Streptomyces violaceusniger]|uniref:Uncharacterized protein n=1 Tax=Streptomyces violaceusniger (strain Tu 4113) TaxID=653045 RepID=G2P7D5_STRV4|nr:hypothetical protein [Streptomyces violaceusniger]AEM87095.1 hypothetical protein Strvi_7760 [Streptomyces violaceusniger Tu 4113]